MVLQRAYSLIECLIVLAVIAILTATGIPSLRSYVERTRDQLLQQQIILAIRTAHHEAKRLGEPVALCRAAEALFIKDQHAQLIRHFAIKVDDGQLHWRSYPYYRSCLAFNAYAVDNATFWYCRSKQSSPAWAVTLSHTGLVQTIYPNHKEVINDSRNRPLVCTTSKYAQQTHYN